MMEPDRWEQIERLYHAALEREPDAREAFLDEACAGDEDLRREVAGLLACDIPSDSFIQSPAIEIAAKAMAAESLNETSTKPMGSPIAVSQIGAYQLLEPLGSGGMGEVHLALDTRLGRKVALKLLPAVFTTDADRVQRFAREARAASALNHPNIITIHEIGETATENGSLRYIVTEYVEGETLRQRLRDTTQQRMKPSEAIEVAAQIAAALSAAHEAGITHRDIKPENVMVRPDGLVKVLDFGLAKLTTPPPEAIDSDAPTLAREMGTTPGMILGTLRYMSPEQARAREVDARSDIFSLGAVLYEMIAGEPLFAGETTADIIATIINKEPEPLAEFTRESPLLGVELDRIVRKALAKDRQSRYQTARDLQIDLQSLKQEIDLTALLGRLRSRAARGVDWGRDLAKKSLSRSGLYSFFQSRWRLAAGVVILAMLIIAGAVWKYAYRNGYESKEDSRLDLRLSQIINLKSSPGGGIFGATFSPDGRLIAFSSRRDGESGIWIKQVSGGEPWPVMLDKWGNYGPVWSPEGDRLAFISNRDGAPGIWSMLYLGGAPTLLKTLELPSTVLTGWAKNEQRIYYEVRSNLWVLELASGEAKQLTSFDPEHSDARHFRVSPDEEWIAYADVVNGKFHLHVRPLRGGQPRQLTDGDWNDTYPAWFPDGQRLAYSSDRTGATQIYLAFLDGRAPVQLTLGDNDYEAPAVSPAGDKIIFTSLRDEANLFSCAVGSGEETTHTTDFGLRLWPSVAPDGASLAFQAAPAHRELWSSAIIVKPLTAQGRPERVASGGFDVAWSPAGDALAFLRGLSANREIWRVSAGGGSERQLTRGGILSGGVTGVPYNRRLTNYSWSPNGAKIAYASAKSGQANLWVVTSDGANEVMITNNMDKNLYLSSPHWAPDGARIAYVLWTISRSANDPTTRSVCVVEGRQTEVVFKRETPLRLLGWSAASREIYIALATSKIQDLPVEVQLLRLARGGGEAATIARIPAAYLHNIKLSPSGRSIALAAREKGKDNVLVVEVSSGAVKRVTRNTDPMAYYTGLTWAPDEQALFYSKQVRWTLVSMIENLKR